MPLDDQGFEAKHQKAMDTLNRQLHPRIMAVRVIGPVMAIISARHAGFLRRGTADMVVSKCLFCNPPPKWYKCPKCDWETTEKWRMTLHNNTDPKWCRDRYDKKVRQWSRQA